MRIVTLRQRIDEMMELPSHQEFFRQVVGETKLAKDKAEPIKPAEKVAKVEVSPLIKKLGTDLLSVGK